jgi:hypothetical protein
LRRFLLSIIAAVSVTACYSHRAAVAPVNPCADTSYVRMRAIPVDSLSAREYEAFRVRDAACIGYQASAPRDSIVNDAQDRSKHLDSTLSILFGAALIGLTYYFYHHCKVHC